MIIKNIQPELQKSETMTVGKLYLALAALLVENPDNQHLEIVTAEGFRLITLDLEWDEYEANIVLYSA